MQSAKVGQTDQPYAFCDAVGASICHDAPAASRRSIRLGTHGTGDDRYGPDPSRFGMHAGSRTGVLVGVACQYASTELSHPQPFPAVACFGGLSATNPSSCAAPSSR